MVIHVVLFVPFALPDGETLHKCAVFRYFKTSMAVIPSMFHGHHTTHKHTHHTRWWFQNFLFPTLLIEIMEMVHTDTLTSMFQSW